ncbi:MAG: excinuclease ABC subunit UvrA [Bacteroidales bacterium]
MDHSGENIVVKGARVNNLQNLDVVIPRNRFVVITGLSGSGKSSLAYDTIYAEGQRRYVESLSAYARQFLGRIHKPEVDFVRGIPPAIAIEQQVNSRNPRSTVGTSTEIYDHLKLLFARAGITYSPVSGLPVKKHSVTDVVNAFMELPPDTQVMILYPLQHRQDGRLPAWLQLLATQGITRCEVNGELFRVEDLLSENRQFTPRDEISVILDRLRVSTSQDVLERVADSAQTAFNEGGGSCILRVFRPEATQLLTFSSRFEADGIQFEEPNVHMFAFNNPYGACPKCQGYGRVVGIDENLVVPDPTRSVFDDAIVCWRGESMSRFKQELIHASSSLGFPIHRAYQSLTEEQRELLWNGNSAFTGIYPFFEMLESQKYKIQYRVMIARYSGKTLCPECKGGRLKREASYVKVQGMTLPEMVRMPVSRLLEWFNAWRPEEPTQEVASRVLLEIRNRLTYLVDVGLGYLTLNRLSSSLSGGESQRINLSTSLASNLTGSLYVLDEPSIGLHSRDTERLIGVLKHLCSLGNTVLVVEHDEEIMRAAHQIIDIGPLAGRLGGELVFQGTVSEMEGATRSLTADYLTGRRSVELPKVRRPWRNFIAYRGARENNLKNLTVQFPLNLLCVVTGVSGSGKSTLVKGLLYPALQRYYSGPTERGEAGLPLEGDLDSLEGVECVDQNPIGRSSRSNPVTYSKAYDEIRKLFAEQPHAVKSGFKPTHFSFNIEGGRCEECQGEGVIKVEMQFMADVLLTCEACGGKKFKEEILEVKYRDCSIFDVLEMTVDEAIQFFSARKGTLEKKIVERLKPLEEVGLGYVKLGQSSSSLSGGESQRVKLASFLGKEKSGSPTLFIFDEPTTGLHFHDIQTLLKAFHALIAKGHSVLVIEHHPDVIRSADWVIDLGPEGGEEGGSLLFTGTPDDLLLSENSYTAAALRRMRPVT